MPVCKEAEANVRGGVAAKREWNSDADCPFEGS